MIIILLSSKIAYFCTDQAPSKTLEDQKYNSRNSHWPRIRNFYLGLGNSSHGRGKNHHSSFPIDRNNQRVRVFLHFHLHLHLLRPPIFLGSPLSLQCCNTSSSTEGDTNGHNEYSSYLYPGKTGWQSKNIDQEWLLKLTLRYAFILTVVPIANCIISKTKFNINCRRGISN